MSDETRPPAPRSRHRPEHWSKGWPKVLAVVVLLALPLAALAWFTCGFGGCPDIDRLGAMAPEGAPVLLTREGEPCAAGEHAAHGLV